MKSTALSSRKKTVIERQAYVGSIGDKIKNIYPLDDEERKFMSDACADIRRGIDANVAFNVKATRGERKTLRTQEMRSGLAQQYALSWIATAVLPIEGGGLGMSLEAACAEIAPRFSFEPDTLKKYWYQRVNNHSDLKTGTFELVS